MQIIKNCNTSILRILNEMLKNARQKKIDQIVELIFLIIKQQVLHFNCDVNTELLLTTIDTFLITNHSTRLKKIKITKKILDAKKYVIDHLRLQRAVTKMFDFNKENNARKTNAVQKTNDYEESEKDEKKKMTDIQQKNKTNEESEKKNDEKKNEREQDAAQYSDFVLSNFDDDLKDFNLDKNNTISLRAREFALLSASQFQSSIVLVDSQSQTLLMNFQS